MQTVEHWKIWREKCALGLCPSEAQRALQAFARERFFNYASAYARTTSVADPGLLTPEPAEAWHCFETHLQLHNTREGKAYKQWLLARAGTGPLDLNAIQSGATLIIRDAVRERLRREFPSRRAVELDAPVVADGSPSAPTLRDLLPAEADTLQEVALRDTEALADAEAGSAFAALSRRERIAILARELGLPLSHPAVIEAARCSRSVLTATFPRALQTLADHVQARFPAEDRETQAILTVLVFERVKTRIISWAKSEIACSRFFYVLEGRFGSEGDHGKKKPS